MVITPIIVVDVHHQEQFHATSYPPPKLLGCVGLSGVPAYSLCQWHSECLE